METRKYWKLKEEASEFFRSVGCYEAEPSDLARSIRFHSLKNSLWTCRRTTWWRHWWTANRIRLTASCSLLVRVSTAVISTSHHPVFRTKQEWGVIIRPEDGSSNFVRSIGTSAKHGITSTTVAIVTAVWEPKMLRSGNGDVTRRFVQCCPGG
jgi:hypothetical protein